MDFKELGLRIACLRREKKISQRLLAEYTGLSRATVNALENGRASDVGMRKVLKIIDCLGYELQLKEKTAFPTFEDLREEF